MVKDTFPTIRIYFYFLTFILFCASNETNSENTWEWKSASIENTEYQNICREYEKGENFGNNLIS